MLIRAWINKGVRKHEHFGAIICISHVPKRKVPEIMEFICVLRKQNAKLARIHTNIFFSSVKN